MNSLVLGGVILILGTSVQCYEWVRVNMEFQIMPKRALRIGSGSTGQIFLGRGKHAGDVLPAGVVPEDKICYVTYNFKTIQLKECEVFTYSRTDEEKLEWRQAQDGYIPPNAIPIGVSRYNPTPENLYAGRVNYQDLIIPGKVHQSHKVCYYPIGNEEKHETNYEVLVYN